MVKRIGAVLAGFVVVVVLSIACDALMHATGVFPAVGQTMSDSLFVLATAYRAVFAVAGGYVTARLAPDRPMRQAIVLGLIGTAVGAAGAIATWNRGPEFGPHWYPVLVALMSLPTCWLGGRLGAGGAQAATPAQRATT
jgi:multisubunit Na+/H+ antiporter MnhB subunit